MCYLRNAFFGSRLIGAEKAASFFNKSVYELTVDEIINEFGKIG